MKEMIHRWIPGLGHVSSADIVSSLGRSVRTWACGIASIAIFLWLLGPCQLRAGEPALANPSPSDPRCFDLGSEFSSTSNPNGSWQYGWKDKVDGPLTLLTTGKASISGDGTRVFAWQFNEHEMPAVVLTGGTLVKAKLAATSSQVCLDPGQDGAPEGYAAVRFTVPKRAGGYYRVEAEVRSAFPGLEQGDSDFHVVVGGRSDFDRFLIPHEVCGYTNSVLLEEGVTVDFVVGRGADGQHRGSRLRLDARLCRTASPENSVFSRVRPLVFDVAQDFSGTQNSNGVWQFGSKKALADPFAPLTQSRSGSDPGVRLCCWAAEEAQVPALCQIAELESAGATNPISRIGGVYWTLRRASDQSDFGITRFTVPPGLGGAYRLECMAARPPAIHDIPFVFQVIVNESNVLAKTNVSGGLASCSTNVSLLDGDIVDFVIRLGGHGPGVPSSVDLMARLTALNPNRATNARPVIDGLTAHWGMNGDLLETQRRAAFSAQGTPGFVPGRSGEALHFDGRDDTVSIQACGAINVGEGQGLTVEFWIRPTALDGWGAILEWTSRVGPLPGMHIYTSVNGSGN